MAAIDKIYGTFDEWCELHHWIACSKRPQYCRYFYPTVSYGMDRGEILMAPVLVDRWLWDTCPFKWVKKELKKMYGGKRP